ncbi:hypothetical protein A8E62_35375 [Burkholderia cenocepacia]|uniref:hypothetical protein n=1 Tax=Burkholderia cenocepacia TaxID=95486 RepID=UPI000981DD77|nr:hypothetical protein [Burkholderia cenocepacia]ONQ62753.1 hypothetical protein A8E06_37475 [Burkholderia cenocepacia]ONQ88035.1 hypothetical protein A8E04_33275 [Burkholderia cenocepacia]ONR41208.1 hypothetical protein A8E12_26705 [Burkholderia cenocepacia]ONT26112.1 hypothetical protein A8E42_08925 [Burkholderia cenocepacia]ONU45428.1 hypothetical protein A8E62_35375 [Burkholderia cenocepacia]
MTIAPIAVHGGVRRIRFRLQTAWHQSRKRRALPVDMGQDGEPPANDRLAVLLDVSQAIGPFPQQN